MSERISKEIELLRTRYADCEFREDGWWVRLPVYRLPSGWNKDVIELAFQFKSGYPQTEPYGFYVPSGLRFGAGELGNFKDPADAQPPFGGTWAFFSGNAKPWVPALDINAGSNVLSWLHSIGQRFREGLGAEE